MKIRLRVKREGLGGPGKVVEVSDERGARWIRDGIAEPYEKPPKAKKASAPASAEAAEEPKPTQDFPRSRRVTID